MCVHLAFPFARRRLCVLKHARIKLIGCFEVPDKDTIDRQRGRDTERATAADRQRERGERWEGDLACTEQVDPV